MGTLSLKSRILLLVAVTIFKFSGHMHALNYNFWSWGIIMGIGWFILCIALEDEEAK